MSFALYMVGFVIFLGGLVWAAVVAGVPQLYIGIGVLVLLGIELASPLYFEAALLIALMGFVGTVSLSKYLLRGDIIE